MDPGSGKVEGSGVGTRKMVTFPLSGISPLLDLSACSSFFSSSCETLIRSRIVRSKFQIPGLSLGYDLGRKIMDEPALQLLLGLITDQQYLRKCVRLFHYRRSQPQSEFRSNHLLASLCSAGGRRRPPYTYFAYCSRGASGIFLPTT
jgi:hypothetical protein